jgi:hypothetical protein
MFKRNPDTRSGLVIDEPATRVLSLVYKFMSKWRQDNPDCQVSDSPEYEKWFKMTRAMCNADPAAMKKLIHNLALITEIEKQD